MIRQYICNDACPALVLVLGLLDYIHVHYVNIVLCTYSCIMELHAEPSSAGHEFNRGEHEEQHIT